MSINFTYSLKWCNLDAFIYNKITPIVNVIRLKLFTLISIVYKYGTLDIGLVNKNFRKLEKEYMDCIKRKWRQDWDMNETL